MGNLARKKRTMLAIVIMATALLIGIIVMLPRNEGYEAEHPLSIVWVEAGEQLSLEPLEADTMRVQFHEVDLSDYWLGNWYER